MKMIEQYEGPYLEAKNLPEAALVRVEIESIDDPGTVKDAKGKLIDKAIVHFKGKKKGLILAKVNYDCLCFILGPNPAEWIGKTVTIQRRYLPSKRNPRHIDNYPCIRVIPPKGTPVSGKVLDFIGTKAPVFKHE